MSRFRPSPAFIVALLALVVAMGGTSYAAVTLAKNSVGSKQIKAGAVKAAELGKNAVTSTKVKDGSLVAADFATGQAPTGPAGPAGPAGAPGVSGYQMVIQDLVVPADSDPTDSTYAHAEVVFSCPDGKRFINGWNVSTDSVMAGLGTPSMDGRTVKISADNPSSTQKTAKFQMLCVTAS